MSAKLADAVCPEKPDPKIMSRAVVEIAQQDRAQHVDAVSTPACNAGKLARISASATMPIGILTKNIQRQDRYVVNAPPASGPARLQTANTVVNIA